MRLHDRIRLARTPIEEFDYDGFEDGQAYAAERPGLDTVGLAHIQRRNPTCTKRTGPCGSNC